MSSKNAWIQAARAELKHESPLQQLQKQWGHWPIKPYFDVDDVGSSNIAPKLSLPHMAPNGWFNLPLVDAKLDSANVLAISHLNNGADGAVFKLSNGIKPSLLLANIKPEFCFLGFEANNNLLSFFQECEPLLQPKEKILGCIFWDDDANWLGIARLFKAHSNFRCFGIHVGTLSNLNIEAALQKAIDVLDVLTDNSFSAQHVLPKMAFSVEASSNFFLDVAMLRSLKILFNRLCHGYGVENIPAFVRLVVKPTALGNYEPHGAMIAGALSALSGVSASVDALTIETENQNSNLHVHTARSVSLLLKEESKLDKVMDPLAGSYFVETLASSIIEKIWTNLKNS